jgi:CHAD domain-containing protein/uncharacterized protein YjbK
MTGGESTEREAKFSAWPGFEVPDLGGLVAGIAVGAGHDDVLDAVYYDTADLRLIRRGITVRHRTGGDEARWTVKFPIDVEANGTDADLLSRREIDLELPPGPPPHEVASLVRAHVRTADLVAVAHLQTRRHQVKLRQGGQTVAEVDDDEVSVFDGEHVAARFREVEVEIEVEEPPEGLLEAITARVREAGAGPPDPTPKLVRALGPRALAPPELVPVDLPSSLTAGELVTAAITASVRRIIDFDHLVRLDADVEGVHQARVGARRLRSDLHTFGPLLDAKRVESIRDELKWLGQELGAVRDADVLLERLHHESGDLSRQVDRDAADRLLERLAVERADALAACIEALDSPRYAALLDELVAIADEVPMGKAADKRADKVVPALVAAPYRKLAKAVGDLDEHPPDAELHAVRKRAKKARYAAEAAVPAIGGPARRLAKALRAVQEVLGEHQDAAVAEAWLREAAGEASPEQAMAAGLLISRQRALADASVDEWRGAWDAASTKKVAGWLPTK